MIDRVAFDSLQWAYGSAVAIVLFALALLSHGPYLYSEYRRGDYEYQRRRFHDDFAVQRTAVRPVSRRVGVLAFYLFPPGRP